MDLMRSLPLGLYLEKPVTWLHRLDARVKLGWLLAFLLVPILASGIFRLAIAAVLVLLTLAAGIPARVWRKQMVWLLTIGTFVVLLTALSPDGYAIDYRPRLPATSLTFAQTQRLPPVPPGPRWWPFRRGPVPGDRAEPLPPEPTFAPPSDYRYWLVEQGPIKISRRSLGLGVRLGSLIFILIYSTTLYLLTTAPEEIAAGLETLLSPLARLRFPVTEVVLTLTLALRFIPLVLEEVQNLVRAVRTRAINWKKIGFRGAITIWITLAERLLDNLLMRADQMASAMKARGFTTVERHEMPLYAPRLRSRDWVAIAALGGFIALRMVWGNP
ncbi:MAG: CbiQ family ECF transporter T component [Cyanophyceae cyanobacterium]